MIEQEIEQREDFFKEFGEILVKHHSENYWPYKKGNKVVKDEVAVNFGQWLRATRQKAALTPAELAASAGAGLSEAKIIALEQGLIRTGEIEPTWIRALSRVLKMDVKDFTQKLGKSPKTVRAGHRSFTHRRKWVTGRSMPAYFFHSMGSVTGQMTRSGFFRQMGLITGTMFVVALLIMILCSGFLTFPSGSGSGGRLLRERGYDYQSRNYDIEDGQNAWINAELVEVEGTEETVAVVPSVIRETSISNQQWVLVADSAADFPGSTQDKKWGYLWSQGRNNFIWQDMTETPDCYRSPNEMTLAIYRDRMTVDSHSRGDAALQWKAQEDGTYRFEWDSREIDGDTLLRFYEHLDFVGSQGPGTELPYSAIVEDVVQQQLFFWVPQGETHYRVKIYKLQG